MNEKHYLALFSEETWNEFLETDCLVYGTTLNKQVRMRVVNQGDYLICYVTKLSLFVGLLEITSSPYIDDHRIWKNDIYPVRVKVLPIYTLNVKNGVPVLELKEELSMFKRLRNPRAWSGFFLNSLNTFHEHDAKLIIDKLKTASKECSMLSQEK